MDRVAEWLRERSLWQVLGVYLAGSWIAFEVIATLTESLGLPTWLPRGAVALIAIGIPIVITAVLLRRRDGLFTLRGALIIGVAAFVVLLTAAGLTSVLRNGALPARSESAPATSARTTYTALADDPRPAIAVLPFVDMSPGGDQEYFSDGITAEVITVLSRIKELRVAARASAFAYKGENLDLRRVGQELGVQYLLGGTVRQDGDQLRISAELVSSADGFGVWSDSYDRRLEGVFVIQAEIAEAIAEELRIPLGLTQEDLVTPTLDMEAHDLYLTGRAALRRRGAGVGEAIGLFEAAVARDSLWGPAWAGLAEAHAIFPLYTGQGRESTDARVWARSFEAAGAAAQRALALDPRNAAAHVARGIAHTQSWEWEDGERELLRAIELDPDSEAAHTQYSEMLWGTGRLDEALRESGRALALDRSPLSLDIHGFVLYMNSRREEAEVALEEGIAIDPEGDMHFLRTVLANLMLFDGRYREAIDRFADYLPDVDRFRRIGEALDTGDATLLPPGDGLTAASGRGLPQALVLLGQPERALDELEKMVFAMPYRVQYDIWDPILAPIRETTRFESVILPRVHLEGKVARYATPPP